MLKIVVPAGEFWNAQTETFINTPRQELQLEHSLVSISKWEAKWEKSFLSDEKTYEETIDYIRCMTLTQNVNPQVYLALTSENITEVSNYIKRPMTATTINNMGPKKHSKEKITSELIYYWMIALNIPMECQKWHLNRLLMLIQVCNIKNSPNKKMGRKDIYSQNRALNEARRRHLNSRG